jgi:hypothetical protein
VIQNEKQKRPILRKRNPPTRLVQILNMAGSKRGAGLRRRNPYDMALDGMQMSICIADMQISI